MKEADLSGANLADADLTQAEAIFGDLDLSSVRGLETVWHSGPSTIGIDTIYKSRGKIPEVFLRGCGLSDWEIEAAKLYDPSLSVSETNEVLYRVAHIRNSEPFEYFSCFISHASEDEAFAEKLHGDLRSKGIKCWFALHDIKGGRKIHVQIDEAIQLHDKLLLILSEHSMASEWVKTEIAKARKREAQEKRQMLFPVTLAPYDPVIRDWECFDADRGKDSAREVREYFIPDFSNWKVHDSYQGAFDRLLRDLKAESATK